MKVFALAAAVIAIVAAPVQAHGPTRQKIVETVEIAKPVDQVWAIIKDFDASPNGILRSPPASPTRAMKSARRARSC